VTSYRLLWNSAADDAPAEEHAPGTRLAIAGTSMQLFQAH